MSTKDFFEARTFAANFYASGIYRGYAPPEVPGMEYLAAGGRLQYRVAPSSTEETT